ncbi:hypothetical protein AM493_04000 [Flavobacterium akiainvivens]|uniref:Uncharacterized protein n=1 Tax=Flavobacterium akiainvivens TaxID=1202724 RepID=A0A0M9VH82_9FLAO|nr:hypothetical protein AM493_04000 [Flavobacterium akiainvivens]
MPNTAIAIQPDGNDKFFAFECWLAGGPYFRKSRRQAFKITGSPACLTAGMQECKSAGITESLLSEYHARLSDGMNDGTEES